MFIKYRINPLDLYLPASPWNDELSYYKQLAALVNYGIPKGFYGYNESHAIVGTMGPWSVFLFAPYYLVFKAIGISLNKVFYVNAIMWSIVLFIVFNKLKFSLKNGIQVSLFLISIASIYRYIFSITPEMVVIMVFMLLFTFTIRYQELQSKKSDFIIIQIALFLLIIMRGYYAAYSLVLFYVFKGSLKKVLITIVNAFCGVLGYIICMHFFACPYFYTLINTSAIKILLNSPLNGIKNLLLIISQSLIEVKDYILNLNNPDVEPAIGIFYIMSSIIILLLLFSGIKKNWLNVISAISFLIIIFAMWVLYDVRTGSRHLLASIIVLGVLYIYNSDFDVVKVFLIIGFSVMTWGMLSDYELEPPRDDGTLKVVLTEQADLLPKKIEVEDGAWNNTVIWTLSCDFRQLYALPDYMGINLCYDDYVIDNYDSLNSKYIAVNDDNEVINDIAVSNNWKVITHSGNVFIYKIR